MKKIFNILLTFGLIIFNYSCIDEDFLGKAKSSKILTFSLENQVGNASIDENTKMITVHVEESTDFSAIKVNSLTVSTFAKVSPEQGAVIDFTSPVIFTVTAENGSVSEYSVIVKRSQKEIQLNNSDFEQWFSPSGKSYKEPGVSATETVWATGNPGVTILGSANVTPKTEGSNTYALLKTVEIPFGKFLGQGLAAGSMFTGIFKLNMGKPIASAKFGIQYSSHPVSFSVNYKYSPGNVVKNGHGTVLPNSKDSCDIGIILTDRSSEPYKQVAIAYIRSNEIVTSWKKLSLNFKYGLINNPENYEKPRDIYILENNTERLVPCVWGTGHEKVTHISVIFSSSCRGDFFEGAPGSELSIDDLTLVY